MNAKDKYKCDRIVETDKDVGQHGLLHQSVQTVSAVVPEGQSSSVLSSAALPLGPETHTELRQQQGNVHKSIAWLYLGPATGAPIRHLSLASVMWSAVSRARTLR